MTARTRPFTAMAMAQSMALWTPCGKSQGSPSTWPTTANTPPRIADLADDKAFATENLRSLRNCTLINMLDGCAISLPAHREGEVPVGLMLAAAGGSDRRIFELAAGMENVIRV